MNYVDTIRRFTADPRARLVGRWAAAVLSGLLLAISYAPWEKPQAAWFALVPLILLALSQSPRAAFRWGFLSGLVGWLVSLSWLLRLAQTSTASPLLIGLAWVGLAGYCALYTGLFALGVAWLGGTIGRRTVPRSTALALLIPLLWVGFEYVRSTAFGGFSWNALGVSQYRNLPLIQVAQWTGVYGLSALLAAFSAGIALTLLRFAPSQTPARYRPHPEFFIPALALAVAFGVGLGAYRRAMPLGDLVNVAVVQPAIPQVKKWTETEVQRILDRLGALTQQVVAREPGVDVVIWPETATPECVTMEGKSRALVLDLASAGVPLLVGSMDGQELGGGAWDWWNSVFLFGPDGRVVDRYDKQHLVPFGEYLPLDRAIPLLRRFAPLGYSCTPGRRATVFRLPGSQVPLSSLICFEDIVPGLSRAFVKAGARLLVNQTNDGWFDRTAQPVQHLSHSVFRAVENRTPMVRAANSGISCWIDARGRIHEPTANSVREAPQPQALAWMIVLPPEDRPLTAYTRWGDWTLGIPCAAFALVVLAAALVRRSPPRALIDGRM